MTERKPPVTQRKRRKDRDAADEIAEILNGYVREHPHLQSALQRRNREGVASDRLAHHVLSAFRGKD